MQRDARAYIAHIDKSRRVMDKVASVQLDEPNSRQ